MDYQAFDPEKLWKGSPEALAIRQALRSAPVLVVGGGTGCGKSTQLPALALEAGWGPILHTQPRRIAVMRLARRLQTTLPSPWNEQVGWQTRFEKFRPPQLAVHVMTEGMVLQHLQRDPTLRAYGGMILDEVHERSINMDLLLGWAQQMRQSRPSFKFLLTSATLETERLSIRFQAPCFTMKTAAYPVTLIHREVEEEGGSLIQELEASIRFLDEEDEGDILIFFPGEAEIIEAVQKLQKLFPDKEVVPLFARGGEELSSRLFHVCRRSRLICATNVAETSLTLPSVTHVIDLGLAKVARTTPRLRRKSLQIEKISQASAQQRQGRCGRVRPGICIRLYSEADWASRPMHPEPEIFRMPLDSAALHLVTLSPKSPEKFPFFDPPDPKRLALAFQHLERLGALRPQTERGFQLTPLGRKMLSCPLEPAWAWVLIHSEKIGLLNEMQVILAGLECDPQAAVPPEEREILQKRALDWRNPSSDFLSLLSLWHQLQAWKKNLSRSEFEARCRWYGLAPERIRNWGRVVQQFQRLFEGSQTCALRPMKAILELSSQLHGLLIQAFPEKLAKWDAVHHGYRGVGGALLAIHPSSGLFKKKAEWIWSAERWSTSKTWALGVAAIPQAWIFQALPDRIEVDYGAPFWDEEQVNSGVRKRQLILGWVLSQVENFPYAQVDPLEARRWFIEEACLRLHLPREKLELPHFEWLKTNWEQQTQLQELEGQLRQSGWVLTDEAQRDFYEQHLPPHIFSEASLKAAFKASEASSQALKWSASPELLRRFQEASKLKAGFPSVWWHEQRSYPLFYRDTPWEPSTDGVCIGFPHDEALSLDWLQGLSWQVPGWRKAWVEALLSQALPRFTPEELSEASKAFLEAHPFNLKVRLDYALAQWLRRKHGLAFFSENWDESQLPAYLKLKVVRLHEAGEVDESLPPRFWRELARQLTVAPPLRAWGHSGFQPQALSGSTLPALWRAELVPIPSLRAGFESEASSSPESEAELAKLERGSQVALKASLFALRPPQFALSPSEWGRYCLEEWIKHEVESRQPFPSSPEAQRRWRKTLLQNGLEWLEFMQELRPHHQACWRALQQLQKVQKQLPSWAQQSLEQLENFWVHRWGRDRAYVPGLASSLAREQAPRWLQSLHRRINLLIQGEGESTEAAWWQAIQKGSELYLKALESLRADPPETAIRRWPGLRAWYTDWDELHLVFFDQRSALRPAPSWPRLQRAWEQWMAGLERSPTLPASKPKLSDAQRAALKRRWSS